MCCPPASHVCIVVLAGARVLLFVGVLRACLVATTPQAMDDLTYCGFRMYDENRQPWGSVPEYFSTGVRMKQLSGGQRHLMCVLESVCCVCVLCVCVCCVCVLHAWVCWMSCVSVCSLLVG
jgi:hypothetical protein